MYPTPQRLTSKRLAAAPLSHRAFVVRVEGYGDGTVIWLPPLGDVG